MTRIRSIDAEGARTFGPEYQEQRGAEPPVVPGVDEASSTERRRVAVVAPEYWPRAGFVAQAASADEVMLGDSFQYSRQSYQNRARLRTPQGWQWISVPLVGGQHGRPIGEVRIATTPDWRGIHCRSLQHHYGTAPFFAHYREEVFGLICAAWPTLGALTCATAEWTLRAFRYSGRISRTSSQHCVLNAVDDLARTLGDVEVVASGETAPRLRQAFPRVLLVDYRESARHQNFEGFVPGLSALDVLFNHGPDGGAVVARDATTSPNFK